MRIAYKRRPYHLNAELLVDALKSLEGIEIHLFLADHQSVQGILLSVQEDHIIVKVKENILYFPITQIKAISKNIKDFTFDNDSQNIAISRVKLEEILKTMYLQWITVNSLNDQSFSGVLSKVSEDYILLINGDRQYFILKSQITNVLNEQVDENQIVPLNSTDTANNNSLLMGEELTKEQKNAIAESIREQVQNFVSRANDEEEPQDSSGISASPVTENEAQQEEKVEQITAPMEEPSSDTQANPSEKMKKQTTAPKKKMKNQKRPLFQEIKFNSPIQECTWNETENGTPQNLTKQREDLKKTESGVAQNIVEIAVNEESAQKILDEAKQKEEAFEIQPAAGEIVAVERENTPVLAEETNKMSGEAFEIQPVTGELVAAQEEAKDETLEGETNTEFLHESVPMLIEDNKRLLEYQYYALMKFAERMYHIENQYRALMKHAEKMYLQLKERRYY